VNQHHQQQIRQKVNSLSMDIFVQIVNQLGQTDHIYKHVHSEVLPGILYWLKNYFFIKNELFGVQIGDKLKCCSGAVTYNK
jgi:hypothetical protein